MSMLWLLGVLMVLCLAVVIKDVFFSQEDEPEKASKPAKLHFWREVTIRKIEE